MAVKRIIEDGSGTGLQASVKNFPNGVEQAAGVLVLTQRFIETEPSTKFFFNSSFGIAMNQNVSFGTISSIMHDGGSSASADSGTADTNTLNKLVETGQNFNTTVVAGMVVHNTTDNTYATITAVDSDTSLSLDSDAFPDGNEEYIINAVWAGTAVAGTWNFADSAKITLTAGDNGDEASIDADTEAAWDMSYFTAFTGKVDLDTYTDANTNIVVSFTLNGVLVGNTVNLDDYIDTGDFTEQSFVIPKADLGLTTQTVNGLTIQIARVGGAKPTFKLDDLHLEASGTPATFEIILKEEDKFHIHELVFAYKDNIDSIQTVTGATENVTNTSLDPDTILGLASLSNGFNITREKAGDTLFSATIHNFGEHIAAGAQAAEVFTAPDGSSTMAILRVVFADPMILTGASDDNLSITINDDMSGLERFTCAARGNLET